MDGVRDQEEFEADQRQFGKELYIHMIQTISSVLNGTTSGFPLPHGMGRTHVCQTPPPEPLLLCLHTRTGCLDESQAVRHTLRLCDWFAEG
jgi:hypothetical protein